MNSRLGKGGTQLAVYSRDYKWLSIILIVAVMYVPFLNPVLPKTEFGGGVPDLDFQRIVLVALMGVTFWTVLIQRSFIQWDNWLTWLLGLGIVVGASPIWSENYSYNVTWIQDFFTDTAMPFIVGIVALSTLRNDRAIRRYCLNAVVIINIFSLHAIYQFITKSSFSESGEIRSSSTVGNANLLAIILVLLQPIVMYTAEVKLIPKWVGYATLGLMVMAIITTVSRKGMITAFLTFEVYFFLTRRYRQLFVSLAFLVVAGIIAMGFPEISQRFGDKELTQDIVGKNAMAEAGIAMLKTSPVIGLGYNGYYENFYKFFPTNEFRKKYDAHNEYVTAVVNFGLVGFALFVGSFVRPLRRGWQLFKRYRRNRMTAETMRVMIGVASLLSFMISQYYAGTIYFHTPSAVCLLFANIGLMLANRKVVVSKSERAE